MAPTPNPTPAGILLVDDDVVTIRALSKALQGMGRLHFAKGGHEALRVVRSEAIDLVLLDAEMPLMSGFQVCEALKADPELAHIPVIFVTSHAEQDIEQAGMTLGAADFIAKPIRPLIVAARVATQLRLKQAADAMRDLALSDSVTGLPNRRAFDAALARDWGRSLRLSEPLSVLLLGIDRFQAYTAEHGRRRGDDCLLSLSQVLGSCLKRPADLASRYDGELFALMLPGTDRAGAGVVVQRVRQQVGSLGLPLAGAGVAPITVSVGYSSYDEACDNWVSDGRSTRESGPVSVCAGDLVEAASLALAQARRSGRGEDSFVSVYRALAERMADLPVP